MMIVAREALRQVVEAAEAAYPAECCGLLVGRTHPNGTIEVTRAHPSPNLGKQPNRFEIDPRLWVDLSRALGRGPMKVVGLYHSHPDGPAQPSAIDLEAAWGEELVWLIVGVSGTPVEGGEPRGQALQVTAHILDLGGRQFRELPLRTADWHAAPVRALPEDGERKKDDGE
ncbi:MAG: M67 family metallopeptidase [Alphaproteobacteria bacterium]|nr:M67 family metallopeptidase [Alphaproteobacteria bacterium]